jgi:hypothetical protein
MSLIQFIELSESKCSLAQVGWRRQWRYTPIEQLFKHRIGVTVKSWLKFGTDSLKSDLKTTIGHSKSDSSS